MLIGLTGHPLRRQTSLTILPMTARQVSWFIDPEALLSHLDDLGVLKIAAACQRCYTLGLPDAVTARFDASTRHWQPACACADYPVINAQGDGPLVIHRPQDDGTIERIPVHSVDELLFRLGWTFRCTADCAKLGMQDGVQGNNDPTAQTLRLTCGCTVRQYQEPSTRVVQ